jgi:hypothetical protein
MEILEHFEDSPEACFSIHSLALKGAQIYEDKKPGDWLGPSTVSEKKSCAFVLSFCSQKISSGLLCAAGSGECKTAVGTAGVGGRIGRYF